MSLRALPDDPDRLILDPTALRALIDALEFQLADFRGRTVEALGEDEFADLQNDIQYLEILLANLQAEHARIGR